MLYKAPIKFIQKQKRNSSTNSQSRAASDISSGHEDLINFSRKLANAFRNRLHDMRTWKWKFENTQKAWLARYAFLQTQCSPLDTRCNMELTFLLPCTACNVPHSPAVLKRQIASPFRDVPSTCGLCCDENNENRLRDLILICPVRSNCDFTSRTTCEKINHRINLGPVSIISACTYTRPTLCFPLLNIFQYFVGHCTVQKTGKNIELRNALYFNKIF